MRIRHPLITSAVLAALGVLVARSAGAAVLYDASVPQVFDGDSGPLYDQPRDATRTQYDDVPINYGTTVNPIVNVTRVSFDVSRGAGAPASTVTAYAAPMVPDSLQNGGPNDLAGFDDPGTPVVLGTFNLPATTAYGRVTVTFGNGTTPIFTTPLDTTWAGPGKPGFFMLGLKFSDPDANNQGNVGWSLADAGPIDFTTGLAANGNIDAAWDYQSPTNFFEYGENDPNNQPIPTAYMMTVEGTVVPEPASAALMLGGAMVLVVRRRGRGV
jgi:hypothetical protein